jgi:cytochrome P450
MAERTAEHVADWTAGDRFDLLREMRRLTLRILGDTLLGVDTEGDEERVHEAADALVDRADPRRPGRLLPDWVPTLAERRFDRAVGRLDEYVEAVLRDRPPGESDVRSVLLRAHERGTLSMDEVRDNLTALLLAGHDSAAVALTYAWYELARRPSAREAVREEAAATFGDDRPGTEAFDALDATRDVVRETLRLYPPTWAVNREATETVSLGGYEIPAGSQVMLPQWVLHRDERFWDEPGTFDPSRWEGDASRPEYAYFPFGGGRRHCIGMRFARLELALALATMVSRADLAVETAGPLSFAPSLSLRPETDVEAVVRRVRPDGRADWTGRGA